MNKLITLGQLVSAVASVVSWFGGAVNQLNAAIKGKADAAPTDGELYGQRGGKWEKLPEQQAVEVASDKDVAEAIDGLFNTDES